MRPRLAHSFHSALVGGVLAGAMACGHAEAASGDHLDRSKLTLTFHEDFDSPLSFWDPRSGQGRWKTCYWFGWQPPGRGCIDKSSRTIDSDGSQYVLVDPAYNGVDPFKQDKGTLFISAARNEHPDDPRTAGRLYTAGMITTEPSFSQRYGYFEIRMKLPLGAGLWPAFWMLPADHSIPFELDVVENLGRDPNTVYCTAHWGDGSSSQFPVKINGIDTPRSYGVLWNSEDIIWYVDDVEVARLPNKDLHMPMYMIAGMGVGGTWGGYPDAGTTFPARMAINYIKAYRLKQ